MAHLSLLIRLLSVTTLSQTLFYSLKDVTTEKKKPCNQRKEA
jgi:hypothetical protein